MSHKLNMSLLRDLLIVSMWCVVLAGSQSVHNISCSCSATSSPQCITLSQCLADVGSCFTENITLVFEPGVHSTDGLSEGFFKIQNWPRSKLQGHNSTIKCNGRMGFFFERMHGLSIEGLSFQNCGTPFTFEILRQIIIYPFSEQMMFFQAHVAIIIANSYNVDVSKVNVSNSSGYGLFLVNILGSSRIHNINISYSNYAAIEQFQDDNFRLCQISKNRDCSGGNVVVYYGQCCTGEHRLSLSSITIEYGANLQSWDAHLNTETAGGLTIAPRQFNQYRVIINVSNSQIAHNTGKYGGNIIVLLYSTNAHITFYNTTILHGNADVKYYADYSNSGGMYTFWGQLSDGFFDKYLEFDNCTFANNSGLIGGAMFISSITDDEVQGSHFGMVNFRNSVIRENHGFNSIVRLSAQKTHESSIVENDPSVTFNNTKLLNNSIMPLTYSDALDTFSIQFDYTSTSTVYVSSSLKLNLFDVTITENAMRGLHMSKCEQLSFSGVNYITGNVATIGGGLMLYKSSFVMLLGSYLYITHNVARTYGGGIYVYENDETNLCFFQAENITSETRVVMRGNSARISGNSIYGGNIDSCQAGGDTLNVNSKSSGLTIFNQLFDISFNVSMTEVTSNIRQLCFCSGDNVDCDNSSKIISVLPGQGFSVAAVAVGQLNGSTVGTAVSQILNGNTSSAMLGVQQNTQELQTSCTQLNFSLSSRENQMARIGLQTSYDKTHYPNNRLLTLEVYTRPCPIGFSLNQQRMVCDCNEFLRRFGAKCYIEQHHNIQLPVAVWIGFHKEDNLLLAHQSCPLQYCRSDVVNFSLADTDLQCLAGHTGILCGGCRENLSAVFGSSACRSCHNRYLSLLLAFLGAGLLLVAAMIYGDLTISQGMFNGLIFYANIVRVHNSILFPAHHINVVTVFIAWLNLDLGIETCFYSGMDTFARACLQFVFPAYVWLLVIVVIAAAWYSKHAARMFGGNAVQVLATLLLLSYTKIQRIILETWSSTFVTHENGSFTVWLSDGNVPFMRGKHIFLGLMSIAVLVGFVFPFTLILLCEYPLQSKFSTFMLRYYLTPLIDAYQGPYKKKFRWWTGAMLLLRGGLLLAFGVNVFGDPRLNLVLIVSVCAVLLGTMWNMGTIYKNRLLNVIESIFIVNLGLLSIWSLYNNYNSDQFLLQQKIVSYTLVGFSLLVFLVTVGVQVFSRVKMRFIKKETGPTLLEKERQIIKVEMNDAYREELLTS